jgi:hypothetical protein
VRFAREVRLRIEQVDRGHARRVFRIQGAAREGFVEKPRPSHMCGGGRRAHHRFDLGLRERIEDALEHQQVCVFVLE